MFSWIVGDDAVVVGDCGLDALGGHLWIIKQVDDALRVVAGLGHLGGGVLQIVNLGCALRDESFWNLEGLAETVVETLREGAGELQVLALIFTDWDKMWAVQQNICCHQHRVGEQTS